MKSKRTRAVDIPPKVRARVAMRDNGLCIICGRQGNPNAHYISRAQGGLGIEENIVSLCLECHNEYDNGKHHKEYGKIIERYLKNNYENWDKEKLIYKKT